LHRNIMTLMKIRLSIVLLLFSLSNQTYGQNIRIADFLQLRTNKKGAIESKLNSFNIHLYDTNELNNGKVQFTFQNETEEAFNFHRINFLYVADAQWNNRLSFQTQETGLVKKYLTEMKALGFYFIGKKTVDRRVYEVYSDGETTIELINSQLKNSVVSETYYIFAFYSSDEYTYAFAYENKKCKLDLSY